MAEWFPSYSEKLLPPAPLGLAIDWTNPQTDGLIAAYVPGIAGGTDLSGNGNNLTIGDISSWNVTIDGPALKQTDTSQTNTGNTYSIPASSKLLMGSGQQSQYWRGLFAGAASGDILFGILQNNAYATPYYFFGIQPNTATTWYPAWNSAGAFTSTAAVTFPTTSATVPFSIAATGKVGGNVTPYQNGVAQPTTAWGSAPTSGTGPLVSLGTLLAPGVFTLGITTNLAFIWDREKSAADIAALDQAPYVFLVATEGEEQAMFRALIAARRLNPLLRR